MTTLALDRPAFKTITLDVVLCAAVAVVPAVSHAAAFPLYMFDPMRLLLFVAILFSSRRNALLMALWLPLLSMMTSGHPVFPKFVLIQAELVLNVVVFYGLFRKNARFVPVAVVSVLASKAFYYAVKFVLVEAALMGGSVVSTPWSYQLATLAFILVGGGLICGLRARQDA